MKLYVWLVLVVLLAGCGESSGSVGDSEDSSTDTSVDSGDTSDTSGTDSEDTSTDSGTDSDSGPPPDCEVVGCENSPDDTCDDEGNLLVYSGSSTCLDHVCQYEFSIELCVYDCREVEGAADECMDDACDGVVCAPAEAFCAPADPEYRNGGGWLVPRIEQKCRVSDGACVPISLVNPAKYCGDRNGCISVGGADDYCDPDVFTPCENDVDCSYRIPSTCEETSGGSVVTNYQDGVCDTDGSLTGTSGECSYTEIVEESDGGCSSYYSN
jgi:hypothetical protein